MRALLDINVLIALLDAGHVHHRLATSWLGDHIRHGWSSCPLTQIGCIRIMAQPAYPNPRPTVQVTERLRLATRDRHHEFWPANVDLLGESAMDWALVLSARHVTDLYLLGLAAANGGRFVTFDRHVPRAAVPGAEARHLVVIEPG
ncbi:MAG: TA system VapC family ribonuclease toxin [Gammaproteobacteria bacterium]